MTCIAITRGGAGTLLKFANLAQADEHALVQYGDPILSGARDIRAFVTTGELVLMLPELASLLEDGERSLRDSYTTDKIWQMMVRASSSPPADPQEVLRQVADDRRATRVSGVQYHSRRGTEQMSDGAVDPVKAVKVPKEKPVRPLNTAAKFAGTSIVTFGVDPEGNAYSPTNNPKRPGSGANERFAKYVSGKTIDENIAGGVTRADILWDVKQKFIVLV